MTLDELIVMEEIKQIKARYCYYVDYQEWDKWAALFTEDATIDTDTAVSTRGRDGKRQPQLKGRAAIHRFIEERMGSASSVHHVHSPIIDILSPTSVKAIWAMEDIVEMPGFHLRAYGHYRDTYRKDADGQWRITAVYLTRLRIDILSGDPSSLKEIES